jgi:hypothetical protein
MGKLDAKNEYLGSLVPYPIDPTNFLLTEQNIQYVINGNEKAIKR